MPFAPNPLLDDLKEEFTAHLIAHGNLINQNRGSHAWKIETPWTSAGYIARVVRQHCDCGEFSDSLLGIFHAETRGSERREQALDIRRHQISLDGEYPVEVSLLPPVYACPKCLAYRGFANYRGE